VNTDWRAEYAAVAEAVTAAAPSAMPLLAGFNTCVDQIHRLGTAELTALAGARSGSGPVARLAAEVLDRADQARDGEIFVPARDEVEPWLVDRLGEPCGRQVGGTGAQASWTLATLGAPSVLALADWSAAQLSVLDPAIGLCTADGVTRLGEITPVGEPTKAPHYILEFTAGTRWPGGVLPRSSRIIVRLADDGLEQDGYFAAASPALATRAGAGLVSGLNAIAESDLAGREWLRGVVAGWRDAGLAAIHLELAEYAQPAAPYALLRAYKGMVFSVGLSLAELASLVAADDPAAGALAVAGEFDLTRVVVHADGWSLAVHRGDPRAAGFALTLANLLAASRARAGRPTADLRLDPVATLDAPRPVSRSLGDGWRVDCVPSPYLFHPAATVGLGDTFVAGLLLSSCLGGDLHLERRP
jgi:ADP-dependent phosphofructokinase/glucokinase